MTWEEQTQKAVDCYNAGATVRHLHVRDPKTGHGSKNYPRGRTQPLRAAELAVADFVDAASLDQLPPGTSMVVAVEGKSVALFNVDGTVYAIDDTCAHAGASLAAGRLQGRIVTCRAHGLRYDVTTGEVTTGGFGVAAYPVKVVDGKILVALDE